jgi:hypothetical protein
MRFLAKNQTLVVPEGYLFRAVETDGAYLRLTYFQAVYAPGTQRVIGENITAIYLNDMGREVGQTVASYRWPEPDVVVEVVRMPRRFRFKNAFLIVLQGLMEMIKCLSK